MSSGDFDPATGLLDRVRATRRGLDCTARGITRPDAGLESSKGFCCCSDGSRYTASVRSGKLVKSIFRNILAVYL
jgi:hypothetical protein